MYLLADLFCCKVILKFAIKSRSGRFEVQHKFAFMINALTHYILNWHLYFTIEGFHMHISIRNFFVFQQGVNRYKAYYT